MTHGFNLGRYIWRKYYFSSQGLIALCATKSRQRQYTYAVVKSGQGLGFFSFYKEFCSAKSSLFYFKIYDDAYMYMSK